MRARVALVIFGLASCKERGPAPIANDVLGFDAHACVADFGRSKHIAFGSQSLTVQRSDGDVCIVRFFNESEGHTQRFECRVPRSAGVVTLEPTQTHAPLPGDCTMYDEGGSNRR